MQQTDSRSGLFLIEMILVILFFSLTTAVCARLFVQAHSTGEESRNLTQSVMIVQNLAEAFYANGGDEEAMLKIFPEADFGENPTAWEWQTEGRDMYLFYDKNWQAMPRSENGNDMMYVAKIHITDDAPYKKANIAVSHVGEYVGYWGSAFYETEVTRYMPEGDAP